MTQLPIKRNINLLHVGDVLERHNGEQCRICAILPDTNNIGGKTIRFRFQGFDVMRPCMRNMFALNDDDAILDGFVPNRSISYAGAHGQVTSSESE